MTQQRVPPPREPACLSRPYPSTQKGGTLIAEAVVDLAEHMRMLVGADGYRPSACPTCRHGMLHVHDYRTRLCQLPATPTVKVVRYGCPACEARWQVLPAFVPRHLGYHWPLVCEGCEQAPPTPRRQVARRPSRRTRQRWLARLASSARLLVQILATSAQACLVGAAQELGLDATRLELVGEVGRPFAEVAALIHRLMPGVRLM